MESNSTLFQSEATSARHILEPFKSFQGPLLSSLPSLISPRCGGEWGWRRKHLGNIFLSLDGIHRLHLVLAAERKKSRFRIHLTSPSLFAARSNPFDFSIKRRMTPAWTPRMIPFVVMSRKLHECFIIHSWGASSLSLSLLVSLPIASIILIMSFFCPARHI